MPKVRIPPSERISKEIVEIIQNLSEQENNQKFLGQLMQLSMGYAVGRKLVQEVLEPYGPSGWQAEYEAWRTRSLADKRYAYLPYGPYGWCDGVYPKAGLQGDKTAFLVVLGVNAQGVKEPLAIVEGYRESTESWGSVLRNLRDRGLADPSLFTGDGALGLWGAINEVYPQAEHQRCWRHKMGNVLTHFPKRLHDQVKLSLQRMYNATTKQECLQLMQQFAQAYGQDYPRAVECLPRRAVRLKDQETLLTFYKYPRQHWASIKTTNPIESVFATVRLRTNAARRIKSPRSALYLIFQLFRRAERNWRRLNAPHLGGRPVWVSKVMEGVKFKDGIEISKETRKQPEMVVA